MPGVLEQVDAYLEDLFKDWGSLTTILAVALLAFVIYPTVTAKEADTHPFLLHRQANVAPVRQPGESAVHRSLNTPQGSALISGLNVKEPGANKWAAGKNGDLRDVWRRASGQVGEDGSPSSNVGKITSIYGVGEHVEHGFNELSRQINRLGLHVKKQGGTTVALYLPNSIETLVTVFAAAFYVFQPVLIPYNQPEDVILKLLHLANADFVIASAGSLDFGGIKKQCPGIKEVMFVVPPTSRHMDFTGGSQGPTIWHDMIESSSSEDTNDLPNDVPPDAVPRIAFIWLDNSPAHGEIVAFTQKNIVAAIAAQIQALPPRHGMTTADTFLAADAFSNPYILVQTLAALFSNASLAIHSVAGTTIDLSLAARSTAPTIIACSPESALKLHTATSASITSLPKKWALGAQLAALKAGYMPGASLSTSLNPPVQATLGDTPGNLRLLYIYERLHTDSPPLSSTVLSHLRAFTGARVIYGLAAAKVAGTVAQTGFYDYRIEEGEGRSHVGAPVGSVEVKLIDAGGARTEDGGQARGEIVAAGPAVLGGSARLGALGTFRGDGTLAYL